MIERALLLFAAVLLFAAGCSNGEVKLPRKAKPAPERVRVIVPAPAPPPKIVPVPVPVPVPRIPHPPRKP